MIEDDLARVDPGDIEQVRQLITAAGGEILRVDAASRRVRVIGAASVWTVLFGTALTMVHSPDPTSGAMIEHRHANQARSLGARRVGQDGKGQVLDPLGREPVRLAPERQLHLRVGVAADRRADRLVLRQVGRRPGKSVTRADIIEAAADSFAKEGYDKASLRGIGTEEIRV